jgi:putative methanogenesis marker protein 2
MEGPVDLEALVSAIRSYPGVTRKHTISDVISSIPSVLPGAVDPEGGRGSVLADFGEDSAVIALDNDPDGEVLLVAADGIMATLLEANPWWAGYCSILVNSMDVAATGGVPFCMVNVVSIREENVGAELLDGMRTGVERFQVPMVGGHTHPGSEYSAIDVAVVGRARRGEVIYSHTARESDAVVVAVDTVGTFHPDFKYSFDSTTTRSPEEVAGRMFAARRLSQKGLLTAGKDISNPGTLGTLGMLLETSGLGAVVDPLAVPAPRDVDPTQWLLAYQGCGFVLTCAETHLGEVLGDLSSSGLEAARIGVVTPGRRLELMTDGAPDRTVLFDFDTEHLTGCGPPSDS